LPYLEAYRGELPCKKAERLDSRDRRVKLDGGKKRKKERKIGRRRSMRAISGIAP